MDVQIICLIRASNASTRDKLAEYHLSCRINFVSRADIKFLRESSHFPRKACKEELADP